MIASALVTLALLTVSASAQPTFKDLAVLNFALNLEYLEANFYTCAVTGLPLSGARIGTGGIVATGCAGKALLSAPVMALATQIAKDEVAHVDFLRAALGAAAVPQPAINIGTAFNAAASAAFNTTALPYAFSAYGSDALFLLSAFIFEDVGVTAYKGGAPALSNAYVGAAAGILAVEAYHAGAVRASLLRMAGQYVFPYGATVSTVSTAIANLRAAVDFLGNNEFGIQGTGGAAIISPVDKNAIAFTRAPVNVFPIVYLGSNSSGGFFPSGMNGVLNSSTTSPAYGL